MNTKNILYYAVALVVGILIGLNIPTKANLSSNILSKDIFEKKINQIVASGPKVVVEKVSKKYDGVIELNLNQNGQKFKLYSNPKGDVFAEQVIDLKEIEKKKKEEKTAGVVKNKTDKPKVELFVMSYCPFGTQTEKGYLPAVRKLGDKIDAKVKFVNYSMHSSKGEVQENLLQYCIEKEQPKKFNNYLACFLEKGDSKGCLAKNGINKKDLNSCITETDKKYDITKNFKDKKSWLNGVFPRFNINDDLNQKYGVQGSPTLVINGQKMERVGRDANSIFKAICSAFKNPPAECKETLSTETPAPGFGYDNKGGNNQSAGDCGA